jgi:hypothetical protein
MAVTDEAVSVRGETRDGVLSLLQQAVRTIDQMWRSAQADGHLAAAVALGEASHGVHRALIALQADGALL